MIHEALTCWDDREETENTQSFKKSYPPAPPAHKTDKA